ncbi:hypothetical protein D3C83_303310 [compost metagenome]
MLEQGGELAMIDLSGAAMEHQEFGLIAPGGGRLGNQFGRQIEFKLVDLHDTFADGI